MKREGEGEEQQEETICYNFQRHSVKEDPRPRGNISSSDPNQSCPQIHPRWSAARGCTYAYDLVESRMYILMCGVFLTLQDIGVLPCCMPVQTHDTQQQKGILAF